MIDFLVAGAFLLTGIMARAELKEIICTPTKGVGQQTDITKKELQKSKTQTKILDGILSHCSLVPSSGKVTCDSYRSDKTEVTKLPTGVTITKYYQFRGQFNVQVYKFQSGKMSFIEDNGRGLIYFGECE